MSTIKIQLETPAIPVEIGKLKFEFNTSDESILAFRQTATTFRDELENVEVADGDEFEKAKDILRKGFDLMLGDGAFEKIYKQTPSVMTVTKYFVVLTQSITEQLNKMGLSETQQQKAQKYVKAKQK
ncbi:MAG: hypothetical protein ABS938_16265 [Psychrobacillus psychrodurans]